MVYVCVCVLCLCNRPIIVDRVIVGGSSMHIYMYLQQSQLAQTKQNRYKSTDRNENR